MGVMINSEPGENWLSPLNKMIWIKEFRKRSELVTIRDGRTFTCKYSNQRFYGKVQPAVWVRSTEWSGPCGWFIMERVTDDAWLEADNKVPQRPVEKPDQARKLKDLIAKVAKEAGFSRGG